MSNNLFGSYRVHCRNCDKKISSEVIQCPHCGENQQNFKLFNDSSVECRNCHEKLSADIAVCPHCGENQEGLKLLDAESTECRNCQKEISTDAKTCPHCGEDQESVKLFGANSVECRNCHKKISSDAKNCPFCGENQEKIKLFGATALNCVTCGYSMSSDAVRCPNCGDPQKGYSYQQKAPISDSASQREDANDGNTSNVLIKWAFYVALFIAAVWFAFAIVLPMAIINVGLICLLAGFIYPKNRITFFTISVIGAVYIGIDFNKGLLTQSLISTFSGFAKVIPALFCLNIVAGLSATFFLTQHIFNYRKPLLNKNELNRRNLLIFCSVFALAITVGALQYTYGNNTDYVALPVTNFNTNTSPTQTSVPTQVSQPVIVTQPAQVTASPDSVKANVQPVDSAKAPISDMVTGENFLKKGVVYEFVRNADTQYNFIPDNNSPSAILTFSLSNNPQRAILQLMANGPQFSIIFGNERPPDGNYLVVSNKDIQFNLNEITGKINVTLDTYTPGAPNMNDFVTQLPPDCRSETMNATTYYITKDNYYYQDWTNPDGSRGFKVVGTPTRRPF